MIISLFNIGVVLGSYVVKPQSEYSQSSAKKTGPENCTYSIDGTQVSLINGFAQQEVVSGAHSKLKTLYYGFESVGDFNADGVTDKAFILMRETGGSGTFFYLAVALLTDNECLQTYTVFLGDRIAPKLISNKNNQIIVDYEDRKKAESMTVQPSISVRRFFIVNETGLTEMNQNATSVKMNRSDNKNEMRLLSKKWVWQYTAYNNGTKLQPNKPGDFSITFVTDEDGNYRMNIKTDCNRMGGLYKAKNGVFSVGRLISTKMYCEGTKEEVFARMLENAVGFQFLNNDVLIIELINDEGAMIFR